MNTDSFFELLSQEGTTQGCPLAMAMYALALVPLVKHIQQACKQVWYADDATGCDKLTKMKQWFDVLCEVGPRYGYFPKPEKCILVIKPGKLEEAKRVFRGTKVLVQAEGSKDDGVEINCEGTRHLGAAVGNADFKATYVNSKIKNWIEMVEKGGDRRHATSRGLRCVHAEPTGSVDLPLPEVSDVFEPRKRFVIRSCTHC